MFKNLKYIFFVICFSGLLLTSCSPAKTDNKARFEKDNSICDFYNAPCRIQKNDLTIDLQLTPFDTPSEKPITVNLTFSEKVSNISMNLTGRDMFMGVIPVNLSSTDGNHYQGQFMFGSCSSNYMVWQINLEYETSNGVQKDTFYFLADSHF